MTVTAERAYKIIRAQLEEEGIAYAPGSYNDYVSRCFYHTNRYGVPQADAEAWASGLSRLSARAAAAHHKELLLAHDGVQHRPPARSVRKKEKENDSSHKKATVEEMEEFINGYMKFRMNTLTHQIETQLIADAYTDRPEASACHWQRLTDHIENSLWCAMQHHGMAVNLNELHTLLGSDFVKEYHPLKECLDGLPPWDGETDYIGPAGRHGACQGKSAQSVAAGQKPGTERPLRNSRPLCRHPETVDGVHDCRRPERDRGEPGDPHPDRAAGQLQDLVHAAYPAARIVRILHHKEQL